MLQNATLLRKSAPGPRNSSDEHVSYCACHGTRNDIWTSNSSPNPSVFCTVDFEICIAPQRRALFRHLNFQKWSGPGVFCTCWLRNVLRTTTACTFSTSQLLNFQKCSEPGVLCTFWLRNVLRATTACNFSSLICPAGSAPAALASLLFDPPEPQTLEKHSVSRLSYLFAHLDLLSSETFSFLMFFLLFSSLTLPIFAFHLSILSEVWLLNFLRLWITTFARWAVLSNIFPNNSTIFNIQCIFCSLCARMALFFLTTGSFFGMYFLGHHLGLLCVWCGIARRC